MKRISAFFNIRQWWLMIAAALLIAALSQLQKYADWGRKLDGFLDDFYYTKDSTSVPFRMQMYDDSYRMAVHIKNYLDTSHIINPVIIFQPQEYFRKMQITVTPPEPAVLYNYTGLSSMYMNNPEAGRKATHFIKIDNYGMRVFKIKGLDSFNAIINPYKRYLFPYRI